MCALCEGVLELWSIWPDCISEGANTHVWASVKGSSMWGCKISCLAQSHFFTHLSSVPPMSDQPVSRRMTNTACQRACVLHSQPYTTHFTVLFHLTYCLMIAPQNWCRPCLWEHVCGRFSLELHARYQSWGYGPCQDTLLMCVLASVCICVW